MGSIEQKGKAVIGTACRAAKKVCRPAVLYDALGTLCTALLLVSLLFTFVFRQVTVVGESMLDTLQDEDRLLVSCLFIRRPGRVIS